MNELLLKIKNGTIKAFLFDLDGTIITIDLVIESLQKAFIKINLQPLSREEIIKLILGRRLREVIPKLFPFLTPEQVENFRSAYYDYYFKNVDKVTLTPYVRELFEFLKSKNFKIGIVSTTSSDRINILKNFNIEYDCEVSGGEVSQPKPSPEPILLACKKLDLNPTQVIMVGDHVFDMKSALFANAGGAIGVLTGVGSEKELRTSGADLIVKDFGELLSLLKSNLDVATFEP
ncbi:MAG: HAD family hydrolase [archaeon]